ncbi:MAG: NAD(P)/FAD-dependent oxidoreductase [Puniceicoccaceae bacterium]
MSEATRPLIVGAGICGLAAAVRLVAAGLSPLILEAADRPGGRIRTDSVEGFQLDRGFQVFNDAYPNASQLLDLPALNLGYFEPGAMIRVAGVFHRVVDPFRRPLSFWSTLRAPVGGFSDKLRIATLRRQVNRGPVDSIWDRPSQTTLSYLKQHGFSDQMVDRFFRPFYGGVFLEDELRTSSQLFEFTFRMFSKGGICLPQGGMESIPQQLAQRLNEDAIRLHSKVVKIESGRVTLESGEAVSGGPIIVATDAASAQKLLGPSSDHPPTAWKSVIALYFSAPRKPVGRPWLVLNAADGGLINSLCVPTVVASGYRSGDEHLVSVTILPRTDLPEDLEKAVRQELASWFGASVASWRLLSLARVERALPEFPPGPPTPRCPEERSPGIWLASEDLDHPSIEGAISLGLRAAEALLS